MLPLHIFFATISLLSVTYAYVNPSSRILMGTYFLMGATFLTGLLLVIEKPIFLGHMCVSGFVYFGFMIVIIKKAQKRFASWNL